MGTGNRYVRRAPRPAGVDAVPDGTVEIRGAELRAALRLGDELPRDPNGKVRETRLASRQ